MTQQEGEAWLVLDICDRCGGSGVIEAVNECPQCDGLGQAWRAVSDDDYDADDVPPGGEE